MNFLTIKQLKEAIYGLPDEAILFGCDPAGIYSDVEHMEQTLVNGKPAFKIELSGSEVIQYDWGLKSYNTENGE